MNRTVLSSLVSNVWREATGDSFIVDVQRVLGAAGAAGYMAKYLLKNSGSREALEAAGFLRRFSRSRDWPSPAPMKISGVVSTLWASGSLPEAAYGLDEETMKRIGDDLAIELGFAKRDKGLLAQFRRLLTDDQGISA